MRRPSVAVPYSMPPRPPLPAGPTWVCQTTLPVAGSTAQYTPLFCPAPSSCSGRWVTGLTVVNRLGPAPKSKSGPVGWRSVHRSPFSVRSAQATEPSLSSRARIESTLPRHQTAHAALLADILDVLHSASPAPSGQSRLPAEEVSPGELR